jgi:ribosome-binding factor A
MSTRRQHQVGEFLREEISEMMQRELKDPRLGLASITRVEMSPDLRYARVFVSVLGSEDERRDTIQALSGASGFLRHLLKPRMRIRHVPEIQFVSDRSMEHAEQIARALNTLREEELDRQEQDQGESPAAGR